MNKLKSIAYRIKRLLNFKRQIAGNFMIAVIIISAIFTSCNTDPYGSHWVEDDMLTICQYLEKNQEQYSKFQQILFEGMMLNALCAYNPYGEDYTLLLPTDEAVENFINQSPEFSSLEEMLEDQGFINQLTRYHTVNKKLHTDAFPDGALTDLTLTGDRLTTTFLQSGDSMLIKVNNRAKIMKANLEMANGYIHVISEVLKKSELTGYEWLQQNEEYSILAQAMEYSRIPNRLGWNNYTILAEHDSVYHKKGIYTVEDLKDRVSATGEHIYNFVAYHILKTDRYLNDFDWGRNNYQTLAHKPMPIVVHQEIKINPGVEIFDTIISEPGDTAIINYVRLVNGKSNILTSSGPVHTISDLLFFEPIP